MQEKNHSKTRLILNNRFSGKLKIMWQKLLIFAITCKLNQKQSVLHEKVSHAILFNWKSLLLERR